MRFIDLFAGIGGFHIAMHKQEFECVFASEIDKFARQTYKHNYASISPFLFENNMFNEDITDPQLDYRDIPSFDVLCAGFPCQPFSHAGHKKGFGDTRGTLFFNIEQIIKTKIDQHQQNPEIDIPTVLFLENVKGLKGHDKGRTFKTIEKHLDQLGYEVSAEVLNSKYFGVPQNRERIFIIAWYRNAVNVEKFRFPYGIDNNNQPIYEKDRVARDHKKTRVGDVLFSREELSHLEEREEKVYTISDRLWAGHTRRLAAHRKKGNGFGYSLFQDDSPYTSTISARYYKDGSEILIDQNQFDLRPRKLHPIEAARLQGYPVDGNNGFNFEIPVSNNQAYKQFGNSVSVPVIEALSKEIKNQLFA